MTDSPMPRLDLVEVLDNLRGEIGRAELAAAGKDITFTFSSIRIELSVVIEKAAATKGGVKFWVLEAGAEAARRSTATHLLAFELQTTSRGRPTKVKGSAFDD